MSNRLASSNVTAMSNITSTISILTDVYTSAVELYPDAPKPSDTNTTDISTTTRRRLLTLPTSLTNLIKAMATTIAESNAVAAKAIEEVRSRDLIPGVAVCGGVQRA